MILARVNCARHVTGPVSPDLTYMVTGSQRWHWRNFSVPSTPAGLPPWRKTNSAKCLLLWHYILSKIMIIWTFS